MTIGAQLPVHIKAARGRIIQFEFRRCETAVYAP
jgi:hypothetical protein